MQQSLDLMMTLCIIWGWRGRPTTLNLCFKKKKFLVQKSFYQVDFGSRVPRSEAEALESGMCAAIKICLKRRHASRIGNENQLLNIKTYVERPILKLGLPIFRWSFYFILLLIESLLFKSIFKTSHMPLSSASLKPSFNIMYIYNVPGTYKKHRF